MNNYAKRDSSARSDRRAAKGAGADPAFLEGESPLDGAAGGQNERVDAERRPPFFLTLVHDGYLDTDGRYYWLTAKNLRLGQAYVDSAQFPRMVRPIVEYVASRAEEHASVGVIDDNELVYIARSKHTPFNSTSVRLGERVPIHCTAGGRLWLASLPESECEAVLQQVTREQRTPYTVSDIATVMDRIAQVRRQGYATIEQEFEIGMLVVAVPLADREGLYWGR